MTCGRTNHTRFACAPAMPDPAGFVSHGHVAPGAPRCSLCCAAEDGELCGQLPCMPDARTDGAWTYFTRAEKAVT